MRLVRILSKLKGFLRGEFEEEKRQMDGLIVSVATMV